MRLGVIFTVLALIGFIGTYFFSHDPALALNTSGVIAAAFLIVLVFKTTQPPFPFGLRLAVIVIGLAGYGALAAGWIIQTRHNYLALQQMLDVQAVEAQQELQLALNKRELGTLEAYYDQKSGGGHESFYDVFARVNPPIDDGSPLLDNIAAQYGWSGFTLPVTVTSHTDESVTIAVGLKPSLRTAAAPSPLGLTAWEPKATLQLSAKGGTYDLTY